MSKYVLMPCSGRIRLNIPRGHVYKVKYAESKDSLGFITEQVAEILYGKENYHISQSDSLCPICNFDIRCDLKLITGKE